MPRRSYKSSVQPLCRLCGKPIPKDTETEFYSEKDGITSVAELRRRTNGIITKTSWWRNSAYTLRYEPRDIKTEYINTAHVWDGESYKDEFFCTETCAAAFGRLYAKQGMATVRYNEALKKRA